MSAHTIELLDPMFAGGVTTTLIKTLTVICERLPEHQRLVQQRLLQELSTLLDGQPYISPGTVLPVRQIGASSSLPTSSSSSSGVVGGADGPSTAAGVVAAVACSAAAPALGGAAVPGVRSRLSGVRGGGGQGGGGGAATSSSTEMTNGSSSSGSSGKSSSSMLPKSETKRLSTTSRFLSKLQLLASAATGGGSGGGGGGEGGSGMAGGHNGAGGMGTRGSQLLTAEAAEVVILALRTLGAFHVDEDVDLLPFVRDCVAQYLDNPHPLVRREAALTCCRLLLVDRGGGGGGREGGRGGSSGSSRKVLRARGPSAGVIEEVLKRLLQVTVADPDPSLRLTLLRALDDGFDPFLCQAHHVRILFLLLHDESLSIRVDAIQVLGRLAALNPAYVLPPMRLALLRLLTEIKFGGRGRGKEGGLGGSGKAGGKGGDADVNGGQGGGGGGGESRAEEATLLLGHFLRAEPLQRLVHPFIRTVVLTLPIQQAPARLAAVGLEALGELAAVVKTDMIPYLDQLLPLAIEHLHDQSSAHKREMALRALGQMACSTGYVIKPYITHPALLPKILSVLREGGSNAMPWSLRREALRTFGVLGALDPYRFQIIQERARRLTAAAAITARPSPTITGGKAYPPPHQQQQQLSLASSAAVLGVMGGGGSRVSAAGGYSHSDMLQQFYRDGAPNLGVGGEGVAPSTMSSELVAIGVGLSDSNREEEDDEDEEEGGAHSYMYEISAMRAQPIDGTTPSGPRLTAASEDYHPTVVIKSLMSILRDASLSAHHSMVTQAVVFIFKSLGMRCAPFLNKIVPNLLYTVRVCEHGLRESIIQELAILAPTVKHHLRPFLSPIFDVITDYWSEYLEQCVSVIENVALHLREDFKLYLPRVLPLLLSSLAAFAASSSSSSASSPSTAVTTSGLTSSPSSLSSSLPSLSSATPTSKPSVPSNTTKNGKGAGGEGGGGGGGGGGEGGGLGGSSSSSSYIARKHRKLELVLRCLTVLRPVLLQEQLLHLVLPALVTLEGSFEGGMEGGKEKEVAAYWQVRTMRTLAHLVRPAAAQVVARSMACPIMHMFYRVLIQEGGGGGGGGMAGGVVVLHPGGGGVGVGGGLPGELREAVMDGLLIMATQLGPQYEAFGGLIGKAVRARGLYTHPTYLLIQARVGGGSGGGGGKLGRGRRRGRERGGEGDDGDGPAGVAGRGDCRVLGLVKHGEGGVGGGGRRGGRRGGRSCGGNAEIACEPT